MKPGNTGGIFGRLALEGFLKLSGIIDRINQGFSWIAAVLVLISCLISAGNAALRYTFSISSNAWLEIQWQMFAGVFLLGAPYVLKLNEHVRVDILYGGASARTKAWIDVFGLIVFLFPATILISVLGWPFFWSSFVSGEHSSNAGGLILWPVKLLLPVGFGLIALQGVSELIKRIAALQGAAQLTVAYEKPLQ